MKVKALSRSSSTYVPVGTTATPLPRNLDPALHPFEKAREYTRALNATKLERVFAKPFLAQLGNGHVDGVYSMCTDPRSLNRVASGSGDGIVKMWDLTDHSEIYETKAHDGNVKDICYIADGRLLTCASDRTVKLWEHRSSKADHADTDGLVSTYLGAESFNSLSQHRSEPKFATASSQIDVWDITRSKPVTSLRWGNDTVNTVRFNQVETPIIASAGNDRTLILYDLRSSSPLQKLITNLKTNCICWNPMEAYNFAAGNEDHNTYIFDMRNLKRALNVLKDHVDAVMDVAYSPTGEEIVTGSYDRTVRIYRAKEGGHSRDVYHTKRMQRVFCTRFTSDAKYILSGSDDGNIRLWRAVAWERSHIRSNAEQVSLEYNEALKQRYKHMPEIKRILRHRHLPAVVKKAGEIKKIELASRKRKDENRRKHEKKRSKRIPEREKMVYALQE